MNDTQAPQVGAPALGDLSPDGWYRWDSDGWIDRRIYFNRQVAAYQGRGYRLVAMDDRMAKLGKFQGPAIPLWANLLLTVITVGLWLPVWLLIELIDSFGHKNGSVTLHI